MQAAIIAGRGIADDRSKSNSALVDEFAHMSI
jgi:hypothetical protein